MPSFLALVLIFPCGIGVIVHYAKLANSIHIIGGAFILDNLSSKAQRIKCLKNGKGIQYLLNEAYAILGNPILVHDMEYKVIELNKNVITDDPIWNSYATTGTVGHAWLEFFKNECFLEAAANSKKITFLLSDKLNYNRIFGKLFNGNNIQVGCAVMVACNKPFEYEDPVLFEDFCAILSTELGTMDFFNDYGQAYFEKLINELIAGVTDTALYAAHVESIYMHLKSNLYLAVADIGKCDPTYTQLAYYREMFKKTRPEYTYAIHANYILIIINIDNQALHVEKDLSELNQLFRESNIFVGISRSFENLFHLNIYYEEALRVLNNGIQSSSQHIFLYEQLMP